MSEWIKWEGGKNPVPGKMVNITFVDGIEDTHAYRSEHLMLSRSGESSSDIGFYKVLEAKAETMRKFESGATRDTNEDKLDYKGFLSMIAIKQFAEYMHKHRKQADGSMRSSDNWKLGIALSSYEESMTRHVFEWLEALERGDREKAFDIAPAIWFNLQGWMHEEGKKRE